MNTYYVKILLFNFLINTLISAHNENCENSHYNRSPIQNNTQRISTKSRLLAQTQNHNPHYHNDPELKEIIDKLNDEAIKKFQRTHESYEQLRERVEKNGKKLTLGNGAEPISKIEKELLETYEKVFGQKNDIMLKLCMYPNDDDRSNKSSCECSDINKTKLAKTKGKDKYLVNLKERCKGGIGFFTVGSIFLTFIGLIAARVGALAALTGYEQAIRNCVTSVAIFNIFDRSTLLSSLLALKVCGEGVRDAAGTAAVAAMNALYPWGIAALVLLILVVVLIMLYIWLYRRRKNSCKHECKKHLCK
ncbi:stevor [Plasmodium reichenowi]|uniref:Stevor n=1 Tax=Plasmodium reichenowi TaxID=5854 RepID=A0A060RM02_PLARE|nr:stevor [Plasmodium reichenowi]